jgi:hypothetical protein
MNDSFRKKRPFFAFDGTRARKHFAKRKENKGRNNSFRVGQVVNLRPIGNRPR